MKDKQTDEDKSCSSNVTVQTIMEVTVSKCGGELKTDKDLYSLPGAGFFSNGTSAL